MVKILDYRGLPCIQLKVCPGASKNELTAAGDFLKIKIKAQPEKGKANRELIEFLAEIFCLRKCDIALVHGDTSKTKRIAFDHKSAAEIREKLNQLLCT